MEVHYDGSNGNLFDQRQFYEQAWSDTFQILPWNQKRLLLFVLLFDLLAQYYGPCQAAGPQEQPPTGGQLVFDDACRLAVFTSHLLRTIQSRCGQKSMALLHFRCDCQRHLHHSYARQSEDGGD